MRTVIEINNLSKQYQLGVIGRDTFYRDFQSFVAMILKKEDPNSLLNSSKEINNSKKFLALKNINLNINEGEVVGIIGKNGAGKSTLLKILSRITTPTEGFVKIEGKIASLLEVGTGFHGELTGRENIYLNGAINGMSVNEVEREIDNIINFSGILLEHIDTPVKRYSSGMIVKLGFSVAAHLNYDILICDEVLAVGDQEFQEKAIKKVKEINSSSNRTVIFVSHNMDSILKICSKVIIFHDGAIQHEGKPEEMINIYLKSNNLFKNYFQKNWSNSNAPQSNYVKLLSISTMDKSGKLKREFDITDKIFIEIKYEILSKGRSFCTNLHFYKDNDFLFQSLDDSINRSWDNPELRDTGVCKQICEIPANLFHLGLIDVNIVIFSPPGDVESTYHIMEPRRSTGIISFNIFESSNNSSRGSYPFSWHKDTKFRPICNWRTNIEK